MVKKNKAKNKDLNNYRSFNPSTNLFYKEVKTLNDHPTLLVLSENFGIIFQFSSFITEKQSVKKEPSRKNMLEMFADTKGGSGEVNHKERVENILTIYQQSQPTLTSLSINKFQFKSCFQKASVINNIAKSLK